MSVRLRSPRHRLDSYSLPIYGFNCIPVTGGDCSQSMPSDMPQGMQWFQLAVTHVSAAVSVRAWIDFSHTQPPPREWLLAEPVDVNRMHLGFNQTGQQTTPY